MKNHILKKITFPMSLLEVNIAELKENSINTDKYLLNPYSNIKNLEKFLDTYFNELLTHFKSINIYFKFRSEIADLMIQYNEYLDSILVYELEESIEELVFSLLLIYKSLLILSMNGYINNIPKSKILILKNISYDLIYYDISQQGFEDAEIISNRIISDFEIDVNKFICDFI